MFLKGRLSTEKQINSIIRHIVCKQNLTFIFIVIELFKKDYFQALTKKNIVLRCNKPLKRG